MTITLGWWIVPTVITTAVLVWALHEAAAARRSNPGMMTLYGRQVATIAWLLGGNVILAAWLVWALVA